jgi:hypothetical protein
MDKPRFEDSEGSFAFVYALSQEEYVEFSIYTYTRTEFHRVRILTNRLVRAIFCSSVAGTFNFLLSGSWIAGCISFAGVAVGGWFLEGRFWRWQIGRIYKRDKTLQEQAKIYISATGATIVRNGVLGSFPWAVDHQGGPDRQWVVSLQWDFAGPDPAAPALRRSGLVCGIGALRAGENRSSVERGPEKIADSSDLAIGTDSN